VISGFDACLFLLRLLCAVHFLIPLGCGTSSGCIGGTMGSWRERHCVFHVLRGCRMPGGIRSACVLVCSDSDGFVAVATEQLERGISCPCSTRRRRRSRHNHSTSARTGSSQGFPGSNISRRRDRSPQDPPLHCHISMSIMDPSGREALSPQRQSRFSHGSGPPDRPPREPSFSIGNGPSDRPMQEQSFLGTHGPSDLPTREQLFQIGCSDAGDRCPGVLV